MIVVKLYLLDLVGKRMDLLEFPNRNTMVNGVFHEVGMTWQRAHTDTLSLDRNARDLNASPIQAKNGPVHHHCHSIELDGLKRDYFHVSFPL